MHLRWLLIAVITMSLSPVIASARSPIRRPIEVEVAPRYSLGAAIDPGVYAGKLVLAFYNPNATRSIELPIRVVADTIQYDWLTVELSNATTSRTLSFVADRTKSAVQTVVIEPMRFHLETIDLDPMTHDLPPGDYDVRVTWDGEVTTTTTTTTTTFAPSRCGLSYRAASEPVPPSPSSKLPYVLAALAIAALLARAGTAGVRVPCSPL